jgi:hypothetical protein
VLVFVVALPILLLLIEQLRRAVAASSDADNE